MKRYGLIVMAMWVAAAGLGVAQDSRPQERKKPAEDPAKASMKAARTVFDRLLKGNHPSLDEAGGAVRDMTKRLSGMCTRQIDAKHVNKEYVQDMVEKCETTRAALAKAIASWDAEFKAMKRGTKRQELNRLLKDARKVYERYGEAKRSLVAVAGRPTSS